MSFFSAIKEATAIATKWVRERFRTSDISPSVDGPEIIIPVAHKPIGMPVSGSDRYAGEFYFKDNILDQLDAYFGILKRMKKADKSGYDLYSVAGMHVVPRRYNSDLLVDGGLSPWWMKTRPTFGAVAIANIVDTGLAQKDEKKKIWTPRFVYFTKYADGKSPPGIERRPGCGDVYTCTIYWDDDAKVAAPTEFAARVSDAGVQILRTLVTTPRTIRSKRHGQFSVPHRRWEIGEFYKGWASEKGLSADLFLAGIFIDAANSFEQANYSMIRIEASNQSGVKAVFGVDITRTPYFFKDRDVSADDSGSRKRIFHIVRSHIRRDGVSVKSHFRGVRDFIWNGYTIKISVPGLHHYNLAELNVGAIDLEKGVRRSRNMLTDAQVAKDLLSKSPYDRRVLH